jgi:hypothetical protein
MLSYIGYITQYISLEGLKTNIAIPDILMEEDVVGLDAVTVTGSAVTTRIDRKLIFPTDRQVQASTNGVDLLRQLMLPRVQVNGITNEVSTVGGGEVQLRINGVKVETGDVAALQPKDIIRVEYHDNPGLRYGNAAAVIDYIVRHHETGGNIGLNLWNDFKLIRFARDYFNARVNHGKSEFSVNYSFLPWEMHQMWRDNEETFHLPDGSTFRRRETGEPGLWKDYRQTLNVTYGFLGDRRMFNASFRYFSDNQLNLDYTGKLYNMDSPGDYVQMLDREKRWSSRPAIDLYWQENLKNDQTLVFNLVGTYNHTDNNRVYSESREGVFLTDVNNVVAGNKYSWIGEGIYERKLGENRLSAGLRHTQAYADNTYLNGHEYRTEMQQGETFLYGEWKGKFRKLDYTLGAGVTRSSFRQASENISYDTWTFNPRMILFYPLSEQSSLRLTASIGNNMPSLSELSAVEQVIDSFQIQRGNPALKPFINYETGMDYEWKKGIFRVNLHGHYHFQPSVIMEEKFWEGNRIVQTWDNQKNRRWISTLLNLNIGPVKDILTLSLNGGVNHFVSNGNNYRHTYTNPYFFSSVTGNYRNFQAFIEWQPLPWTYLYGETVTAGEVLHMLSLGYRHGELYFGLAAFNPFANDYRQDFENKSALASYKRSRYINDFPRMMLFQFSWNINFGRAFQSGQKRLNNADEDAGVMKAGK